MSCWCIIYAWSNKVHLDLLVKCVFFCDLRGSKGIFGIFLSFWTAKGFFILGLGINQYFRDFQSFVITVKMHNNDTVTPLDTGEEVLFCLGTGMAIWFPWDWDYHISPLGTVIDINWGTTWKRIWQSSSCAWNAQLLVFFLPYLPEQVNT